MYKIMIHIETHTGDTWFYYQEDGKDYVANTLQEIKDTALTLIDVYGEDCIKIVKQETGDDMDGSVETFIYDSTDNYEELINRPSINGIEIVGELSLDALGIQPAGDYATREDIQNISLENYATNERVDQVEAKVDAIDLESYATMDYLDEVVAGIDFSASNENITGVKTFSVLPRSTVAPIAEDELTNKAYVDHGVENCASKEYVNEAIANIEIPEVNLSNYYTKEEVNGLIPSSSISQVTSLPTASANNLGAVYQYIGNTNDTYTKGNYYVCVTNPRVTVYNDRITQYVWANASLSDLRKSIPLYTYMNASNVYLTPGTHVVDSAPVKNQLSQIVKPYLNDYSPYIMLYCETSSSAGEYRKCLFTQNYRLNNSLYLEGDVTSISDPQKMAHVKMTFSGGNFDTYTYSGTVTITVTERTAGNGDIKLDDYYNKEEIDQIVSEIQIDGEVMAEMSVFSTEEQVTGTWIDGKPLYSRMVVLDNIGKSPNMTIPFDFDGSILDKVWIDETSAFAINDFESFALSSYYDNNVWIKAWVNKNLGGIRLRCSVDLEGYAAYMKLLYTKTTDEPGSSTLKYYPITQEAIDASIAAAIGNVLEGEY